MDVCQDGLHQNFRCLQILGFILVLFCYFPPPSSLKDKLNKSLSARHTCCKGAKGNRGTKSGADKTQELEGGLGWAFGLKAVKSNGTVLYEVIVGSKMCLSRTQRTLLLDTAWYYLVLYSWTFGKHIFICFVISAETRASLQNDAHYSVASGSCSSPACKGIWQTG